ncbi:bifunctional Peptidase C13 [Babesia duncani]|uniref:Bifunctional Peptidase C13 n=1 Tax=Babesia duncani TaxID=323732 RepID=A0AAD9PJP4_9APIC|nr:bifunctional Peptidase C13 [Babesia duncani]
MLDYLDHSMSAIGPDVFGITSLYRSEYEKQQDAFEKEFGTESNGNPSRFSVEWFEKLQKTLENHEQGMRMRYKELTSVLASTSRFYYNYRHAGNVSGVASCIRRYGLGSNRNTVSFIPEPCLCHPINPAPGRLYITSSVGPSNYLKPISQDEINVFDEYQEIAFKGDEIGREHFRYIMTERYPAKYPRSARIMPKHRVDQQHTNVQDGLPVRLIYITGHGGDSYLQMQAKDSISALDIKLYFAELHIKEPNRQTFAILDTCQAETMFSTVGDKMPLVWIASSIKGESSYSHNANTTLSIPTVDRFSYYLNNYLTLCMQNFQGGKQPRAARSMLSFNRLLRHQERENPTDKVSYHVNDSLLEPGKKGEKMYIGQYFINYRMAYYNKNKIPLAPLDTCMQRKKLLPLKTAAITVDSEPDLILPEMLGLCKKKREVVYVLQYIKAVCILALGVWMMKHSPIWAGRAWCV